MIHINLAPPQREKKVSEKNFYFSNFSRFTSIKINLLPPAMRKRQSFLESLLARPVYRKLEKKRETLEACVLPDVKYHYAPKINLLGSVQQKKGLYHRISEYFLYRRF